jgi:hypothetical protein
MNENQERWAVASDSFSAGIMVNHIAQEAIPPERKTLIRGFSVRMAVAVAMIYAGYLAIGGGDAPE